MPEGVTLDPAMEGELKTLAGQLNLKQEDAQRVADLGAKLAKNIGDAHAAVVAKARTDWQAAAKLDKEIGGDKFAANLAVAGNVFRQFGTPELKTLLDNSGLGDHPEMIRWARRVAAAIGEDRFVTGQPAGQQPVGEDRNAQIAERLYGGKKPAAA